MKLHDDNAELTLYADQEAKFPKLVLTGTSIGGSRHSIWLSLEEERRLSALLRARSTIRADWGALGGS